MESMEMIMATDRSFANMINQMPVKKQAMKEEKPAQSPWTKMAKKGDKNAC